MSVSSLSLDQKVLRNIDEVENYLTSGYGHVMNTGAEKSDKDFDIEHNGTVTYTFTSKL